MDVVNDSLGFGGGAVGFSNTPHEEALVLDAAVAGSISGLVIFVACLPSLSTYFSVFTLSNKRTLEPKIRKKRKKRSE